MFEEYQQDLTSESVVIEALNKLFILHADHEQELFITLRMLEFFSCRFIRVNIFRISALWGPLHGGANQAVLEMLNTSKWWGRDKYMAKQRLKTILFLG
jgi:citrate synthase